MQEERADLEDAPETPLTNPPGDVLPAGIEGQLRRAAHEEIRVGLHFGQDRTVGGLIDAERLLPKKVLPGLERGDVKLLVEVVRNRTVDRFNGVVGQDFAVVRDEPRLRLEPLVPGENVGIGIADDSKLRRNAEIGEMNPAGRCARELPAHQTAADQPEADDAVSHRRPAASRHPRRNSRRARSP